MTGLYYDVTTSKPGDNLQFIKDVQLHLRKIQLDGWLVYDYHGLNPLSSFFLGAGSQMVSRRWCYFIPVTGSPTYLFHYIEQGLSTLFPGDCLFYSSWQQFQQKMKHILKDSTRIAMEYSHNCALPSISRVDAGTIEMIRSFGIEPSTSADLIQYFTCRLTASQIQSHRKAISLLYEIKDTIINGLQQDLKQGYFPTEYQVQQRYIALFEHHGLMTEFPPIVAVGNHSGDPHYQPHSDQSRQLEPDNILLLDTWAKCRETDSVYGDITWMVYLGSDPPDEMKKVFIVVRDARDAVINALNETHKRGIRMHGFEADDIARNVISEAGYGQYFTHRTGHNLGSDVHGFGANLDNLETHEERYLIPETAFTIEPGIYLDRFGVRSEINVFYDPDQGIQVTTPPQSEITTVLV